MKKLFALLLALCMLCGVVSAGAEEATREVELYGSKFRIPAELAINEYMNSVVYARLRAQCETYELSFYVTDWDVWGMDFKDMSPESEQGNNIYWMFSWILGLPRREAIDIEYRFEDIGMEDGKFVCVSDMDTSVFIGHTDGDYGYLILISSETGKSSDEMIEIGKQIALSFQRVGAE